MKIITIEQNTDIDQSLDVDLKLCFETTPPIMVPMSDRAKLHFSLPEGVEGVILVGELEHVLGSVPADYVMQNTDDYPATVAIGGISKLH